MISCVFVHSIPWCLRIYQFEYMLPLLWMCIVSYTSQFLGLNWTIFFFFLNFSYWGLELHVSVTTFLQTKNTPGFVSITFVDFDSNLWLLFFFLFSIFVLHNFYIVLHNFYILVTVLSFLLVFESVSTCRMLIIFSWWHDSMLFH